MIKAKSLFWRVPFIWKAVGSFVIILGLILTQFYFLTEFFNQQYGGSWHFLDLWGQMGIGLSCLFLIMIGMFVLFSWDVMKFIKSINASMRDTLTERKLNDTFEHFYKGKTFAEILENIDHLFSLLKSFDNMKAARISMDTNTSKILMSNVDEGVLFINQEKVVTHINHKGEQMLRLIPGEIIGQGISRKISNQNMLDQLNEALEFDKKIIGQEVSIKEEEVLNMQVFPIKNKFGEIVRAMIILKKSEKDQPKLF